MVTDPGAQVLTTHSSAHGANSALGIALGKLIALPNDLSLGIIVTDLATLAVRTYPTTGTFPPNRLPSSGGLWWERRSGIDSRTGQAWCIGSDGELYVCNGILTGAPKWTNVPTYGTKPSANTDQAIVFALDENRNTIVGWCGKNKWVTDSGETPVRTAWALNLGTLVWRQVGNTGGPPPAEVAAYNGLIYDYFAQSLILCIANANSGSGTRVWRLQLEGPQV